MSASTPGDCPFCSLSAERILLANEHGVVVRDAFPVVPGHTLIVARRHVADFFDLTPQEAAGLLDLLGKAKKELDAEMAPEGYNIGVNVGEAAGQTVMHAHVHLIPRRHGDVQDPTGGVRNIIPGRGTW